MEELKWKIFHPYRRKCYNSVWNLQSTRENGVNGTCGTSVHSELFMVSACLWMVRGTSVHSEWFMVSACVWMVLGTSFHGECYMIPVCNVWYLVPAYTWIVQGTSLHCEWHILPDRMVCMCMVPLWKLHGTRADGVHVYGTIVTEVKIALYQSGWCACTWYHCEGSERCIVQYQSEICDF